jgi:hypothetical protein
MSSMVGLHAVKCCTNYSYLIVRETSECCWGHHTVFKNQQDTLLVNYNLLLQIVLK